MHQGQNEGSLRSYWNETFALKQGNITLPGKLPKLSEIPNMRVTFFVLFGDFFLDTWPYLLRTTHFFLFFLKSPIVFFT